MSTVLGRAFVTAARNVNENTLLIVYSFLNSSAKEENPERLDHISNRRQMFFCLPYINCNHIRQQRERKLDICGECTKLLRETIEPVFDVLKESSECIEKYHGSPNILNDIQKNVKRVTKKQLVGKIQHFSLELQLITEAWSVHVGNPLCLGQGLEKHFTRILCLLKPTNRARRHCTLQTHFLGPLNPSSTATKGYTSNYLIDIYITLEGFLSTLNR